MFGLKKSPSPEKSALPVANPGAYATPAANGATTDVGTTLSPEEAQRRAAATMRLSQRFAQVVTVLMRSPLHKHFSLADLEWLVVPPLLTGQCCVAEAKAPDGSGTPIAVVLWASVSPEVDKRLSENLNTSVRLRPNEWKSGDTL